LFIIEDSGISTIGDNLRHITRNWEDEVEFIFASIVSYSMGYINGIQLAKFGFLIYRTLSIYLNMRLKVIASVILLYCIKWYLPWWHF